MLFVRLSLLPDFPTPSLPSTAILTSFMSAAVKTKKKKKKKEPLSSVSNSEM